MATNVLRRVVNVAAENENQFDVALTVVVLRKNESW